MDLVSSAVAARAFAVCWILVPALAAQVRKLNDPLASGVVGDVTAFKVSPDSRIVVYRADQDADDVFRLWAVPIAGGAVVALTPVPVAGGDVSELSYAPFPVADAQQDFELGRNSRRVVYRGDLAQDEVVELWSAALDGHTPAIHLNGTLAPGGDVRNFRIAPVRGRVVYLADQDAAGRVELYSVPLLGGPAVKLSAPLVAGGDVGRFLITSDGARVVYLADEDTDERFELYGVSVTGGPVVKLSTGTDSVFEFALSPDGQRTVYGHGPTYQATDLLSVPTVGGPSTVLSPTPPGPFEITANSQRVVHLGPGDLRYGQLWSTPIAGGPSTKLTEVGYGRIWDFVIGPDQQRVAFNFERGKHPSEVWTVPLAGGPSVRLTDTANYVALDAFSPDSSSIVYSDSNPDTWSAPAAGGVPVLLTIGYSYLLGFSADARRAIRVEDPFAARSVIYDTSLADGTQTAISPPCVSGGGIYEAQLVAGSTRIVYRADQDLDEVFELYSLPIAGGPATKLNAPLVQFGTAGDVQRASFTPDGSRAVYLADQDIDETMELYSLALPGGAPVKLNNPLVLSGDVRDFIVSSDGQHVLYLADQEVDEVRDLYHVLVDGGPAVRRSDPRGQFSGVNRLAVSPDAARVVYTNYTRATSTGLRLHSAPLVAGPSVELSPTMPDDFSTSDFWITPDSSRVVFAAHRMGAGPFEQRLYVVPITGGVPLELTADFLPGGTLAMVAGNPNFLARIQPDSATVLYTARRATGAPVHLYSVGIDGGAATQVSAPLVAGGNVAGVDVAADGSACVYFADQEVVGKNELYDVALPSLVWTKLSAPLLANGDVVSLAISPDAARVVYRADAFVDQRFELFGVAIGGGSVAQLSPPLPATGDVESFALRFSPDSARVLFVADETFDGVMDLFSAPVAGGAIAEISGGDVRQFTVGDRRVTYLLGVDGVVELWSAPLAGGPSRRVNAFLPEGGDVAGFDVSGDSVLYRADQDEDETIELYLRQLARVMRAH